MPLRALATLLLVLALPAAHAAEPRIGLVLGGGGAKGAAHIGVLKVLEREHIPVHAIAGTSMGAIVGAAYAAGYSPQEIEDIIGSVDWDDVFHDSTPRVEQPLRQKETDIGIVANLEVGLDNGRLRIPTTLIRGQKLGLLLRRLFLGRSTLASFDELPIPFRSVATDAQAVHPVVMSSGDLEVAVRASMSVPGFFSPVDNGGQTLIDGGIVDNVPVDVARAMGVTHLIVVNVGTTSTPAPPKVDTAPELVLHLLGGLMHQRTLASLASLAPGDVLLEPDMGTLVSTDFPDAKLGIRPGEEAALRKVGELRRFALPEQQYLAWQATQRQPYRAPGSIDEVVVDASRSRTAEYVRDRISAQPGQPLDVDTLERDIRGAYGRGTYEYINYHVANDAQGATALHIQPVDSVLGRTVFRAGAQISDDFAGRDDYQLDLEARVTGITHKGGEWRTFVSMGRLAGIETDLYLPFGRRGAWFFSPEAEFVARNQPAVLDNLTFAQYRVQSWSGALRLGHDFGSRLRVGAALTRGQDHADRKIGSPLLPESATVDLGGVALSALWDSLDDVRFPTHGMRAQISYAAYDTQLGGDFDGNLLNVAIDKAMSFGRHTLLLGGRASLASDSVDAYQTDSTLGGLAFLSGYGERELEDRQMLLLRGIYLHRLTSHHMFLDIPLYLGASIEGGNVWSRSSDVSLDDLQGAASVFLGIDLPIGPLQLGYGRNFDGRDSFHLTFSSLVLPRYR